MFSIGCHVKCGTFFHLCIVLITVAACLAWTLMFFGCLFSLHLIRFRLFVSLFYIAVLTSILAACTFAYTVTDTFIFIVYIVVRRSLPRKHDDHLFSRRMSFILWYVCDKSHDNVKTIANVHLWIVCINVPTHWTLMNRNGERFANENKIKEKLSLKFNETKECQRQSGGGWDDGKTSDKTIYRKIEA